MSAQPPPSVLAPWSGGRVTPRAHCVLAPNPGPMTLDGTNTWVLLEPGGTEAVVIDPGAEGDFGTGDFDTADCLGDRDGLPEPCGALAAPLEFGSADLPGGVVERRLLSAFGLGREVLPFADRGRPTDLLESGERVVNRAPGARDAGRCGEQCYQKQECSLAHLGLLHRPDNVWAEGSIRRSNTDSLAHRRRG